MLSDLGKGIIGAHGFMFLYYLLGVGRQRVATGKAPLKSGEIWSNGLFCRSEGHRVMFARGVIRVCLANGVFCCVWLIFLDVGFV